MVSSSTPPGAADRYLSPATAIAVVVVVASAVANGLLYVSHGWRVWVIAGGVAYALTATLGLSLVERWRPGWLWPMLALQAVLGVFMITVCPGASLIVMPLVSCAVLYGSTRIACAVSSGLTAWFILWSLRCGFMWHEVWHGAASFAAANAFVVVFSRIVVRERHARADVERLATEVARANEQLREYAEKVEELATTKERNRVAREIHDGLGHSLTVASVQIEAARIMLERDPSRADSCLIRAREANQRGLLEVRRSVAMLREPIGTGRPLSEAVSSLADECSASGVPTSFVTVGSPRPLSPTLELALYRAAQEGLTNVKRHARATRAALILSFGGDAVKLAVEDDGVGATETKGGFGLLGVQERVALLGGTLAVKTAEGCGFALEVQFPT